MTTNKAIPSAPKGKWRWAWIIVAAALLLAVLAGIGGQMSSPTSPTTAPSPAVTAADPDPPAVEAVVNPTLEPGQTHIFTDGTTIKYEVRRYTYPATLFGSPTPKEDRAKRYALVRLTYLNKTAQPRIMDPILLQVTDPNGEPWTVTLGVDTRQASGPVQPGGTGVNETVYRAPDHSPQATEGFGLIYEPWPDGQGIVGPQGTMPESVSVHFDTARLP